MADAATATPLEADVPLLVPREVSQAKLDEELAQWEANAAAYRRRGWVLLDAHDLEVDVAFIGSVSLIDKNLPAITVTIRLSYDNYDLWPPSLTFIDAKTGDPALPLVQALERVGTTGEVRNVLLDHPNGRPFLCLPGLREYHSHPQHSGDAWLLHRTSGAGRLAVICDRVWRRMVRNVIGLTMQVSSLPAGHGVHVATGITQGDFEAIPPPAVTAS